MSIAHAHSGESFDGIYWANGEYLNPAIEQLTFLMRDRTRGDKVLPIDPTLFDLLADLNQQICCEEPFLLVSGYRAPGPAKRGKGRGSARHSWHVDGKAIDIRLTQRSLRDVGRTAIAMKRGGVGIYGGSHLHLDVGPVRVWG